MIPNETYELRNLYFQRSQYCAQQPDKGYSLLLKWPEKAYFKKFELDARLLEKVLSPDTEQRFSSVADKIFGNQKRIEYLGLKHLATLFYERCGLHKQHMKEIDSAHVRIQEKMFGVKINNFPDGARRLSNLEGQLLQLEGQRRDEELAFWKDTVELREKLFANAGEYRAAKHRYSVLSDVEADYGR